jgi:hypothetical protein
MDADNTCPDDQVLFHHFQKVFLQDYIGELCEEAFIRMFQLDQQQTKLATDGREILSYREIFIPSAHFNFSDAYQYRPIKSTVKIPYPDTQ